MGEGLNNIMELSITIIGVISYSVISGAFLPFMFFYLKGFYKKHKSVKQLILRFVLLFFSAGIILNLLVIISGSTKFMTDEKYMNWFIIFSNIGFWGGIILFRIGYKRGLKHRTLEINKSK